MTHLPRNDCPAPPIPSIGSLFSGYGGLDQAVTAVTGAQVAWHCENNKAAATLLRHRHPGVPNLGDIAAVDWTAVPHVDVLTGGPPCVDISTRGRQAGMRPGTRSGLWSHMAYAVDILRPSLVVIENVRNLLSVNAHGRVEPCPWCVGDRAEQCVRALGAILADLADLGYHAAWCGLRASDVGAPHGRFRVFVAAVADPDGIRPVRAGRAWRRRPGPAHRRTTADTTAGDVDWQEYAPAIRQWETILGRPVPAPTVAGPRGGQPLNPAFAEWLMGLPEGHVTAVPGLSASDMLRLLGNGVVPRQAAVALGWLLPQLTASGALMSEVTAA